MAVENRILILDEARITPIIAEYPWTNFIDEHDDVHLYIFTSIGVLCNRERRVRTVGLGHAPHTSLHTYLYEI